MKGRKLHLCKLFSIHVLQEREIVFNRCNSNYGKEKESIHNVMTIPPIFHLHSLQYRASIDTVEYGSPIQL